jgi:hypothetical protein
LVMGNEIRVTAIVAIRNKAIATADLSLDIFHSP